MHDVPQTMVRPETWDAMWLTYFVDNRFANNSSVAIPFMVPVLRYTMGFWKDHWIFFRHLRCFCSTFQTTYTKLVQEQR